MDDTSTTAASAASDDVEGPGQWTADEARVLGALMEKGLATPQNYPLSVNALTMACNQTTNRDPVMVLEEARIQDILAECKGRGLLRFVHPRSGRGVTKYRQVVDEVLDLESDCLALLSVLLLRGPQTVGELRTRTDRLHQFNGTADVEAALAALSDAGAQPLVRLLERELGHREARWIQLLCPAQGEERIGQEPGSGAVLGVGRDFGGAEAQPTSSWPVAPQEAETLRLKIDDLRQELVDLRADFEAFRSEFS